MSALCTSDPLPESTPATLVSAWVSRCCMSSRALCSTSRKPFSAPVAEPAEGNSVSAGRMRSEEMAFIDSSLQTSAQDLQRLLNHVFRGLHGGCIQLVGAHGAQQVRHLHDRVYVGIRYVAG